MSPHCISGVRQRKKKEKKKKRAQLRKSKGHRGTAHSYCKTTLTHLQGWESKWNYSVHNTRPQPNPQCRAELCTWTAFRQVMHVATIRPLKTGWSELPWTDIFDERSLVSWNGSGRGLFTTRTTQDSLFFIHIAVFLPVVATFTVFTHNYVSPLCRQQTVTLLCVLPSETHSGHLQWFHPEGGSGIPQIWV